MQSQLFKMLTLPLVFSFSLSVYLLFETEYTSRMCPFESSSPITDPLSLREDAQVVDQNNTNHNKSST